MVVVVVAVVAVVVVQRANMDLSSTRILTAANRAGRIEQHDEEGKSDQMECVGNCLPEADFLPPLEGDKARVTVTVFVRS